MAENKKDVDLLGKSFFLVASNDTLTVAATYNSAEYRGKILSRFSDSEVHFKQTFDLLNYKKNASAAVKQDSTLLTDSLRLVLLLEELRIKNTHCYQTIQPVLSGNMQDDIRYLDGEKIILGHLCHKAVVITEFGDEITVWFAVDIPPLRSRDKGWAQLPGLPLYRQFEKNGQRITLIASELDQTLPNVSMFSVSNDCLKMTKGEYDSKN
jgi:hypothetical protein